MEQLELSKLSKLRKMEDLKKLIGRIANEENRNRYIECNNSRYFMQEKNNAVSSRYNKVELFLT